ncbi:MAG: lipid A deacylase LpxR family protein [Flavobacteriaceae bacterium]|nr:lipid A deacylase LpxR family protein [Flavobacteriaceae bacterium]
MKCTFLGLFFFVVTTTFSQQKLSKEFSFVSDNDLYVSIKKDQYYSNGIFLSYRYLASDFGDYEKKIYEFQLGHEIYTPFKPTVISVLQHDRPFAGYLYGSFGILRAYKNKSILKTNIQFGVMGPNAMGEELQKAIHRIYNFALPVGWKYQIKNTLALNFDVNYIKSLLTDVSNHYDINFINRLRVGTIFNEISSGFMGRIGFSELQSIHNSIAFNTSLNNENTNFTRGIESFLYYQTSLTYVLYDATIEGSLFTKNSPLTFKPKSFRFDLEVGFKFTSNRWNFGYAYHFHSNKLPNLRKNKGNDYGRLIFSYLFN